MPIVLSEEGNVAAFPFGAPLHVPAVVDGRTNKILWIVREPRNGSPLTIAGHPVGAPTPTVASTFAGNGGPGEIYSTVVDVPIEGCWHFTLTWDADTAHIDLLYGSGS
jgi:hypothetical protein